MSTLPDLVALSLLPVWRWRIIHEQLRDGWSPASVLHEHCRDRNAAAGARRRSAPDAAQLRARADGALLKAARMGIEPIGVTDAAYPAALRAIDDPPPVLWLRGQVEVLHGIAVAIVGSRAGTSYALTIAEQLGADLAREGVTVVSGLARGVDSAAHRGALAAGGPTVAVLGCGVDVMYPPEHATLAADIVRSGALVSEHPPGAPPHPRFFPQRNRIISGLSRAVVVVEAGDKSGSLITARAALEQGRDVLAVPGSILSGRNRGGHALLRDGAKIVESADDILEELGVGPRVGGARADTGWASDAPGSHDVTPAPQGILACFDPGEACDLDALVERSGLRPEELLPRLLELELRGVVRRAGGGRFVRVDRSC